MIMFSGSLYMHDATLCLLVKNNQVYLAEKIDKNGFGVGKYNGYGGKVEKYDKTIEDAAIRETYQEGPVHIRKENLMKVAEIEFLFPDVPKEKDFEQIVNVYIVKVWFGQLTGKDEMGKGELYDFDKLPLDNMWEADRDWMPLVLFGKKIKAGYTYYNNKPVERNYLNYVEKF